MTKTAWIVGLAALLAPAGASAQAFTNGDFETYQGAAGPAGIRTFVSGGDVTGWVASGVGTIYEAAPNDGIASAGDGTHWISFGHNGATGASLAQTFATALGTTYTVNYLTRQQQGNDASQFFTVGIDGGPSVASGPLGVNDWLAGTSLVFAGTGGLVTLRFTDSTPVGGGFANLALDAVTLNAATDGVPEPATWAMLMAGFGATGAALRRRREAALA